MFPLHFPYRASPCAIRFQLSSTNVTRDHAASIFRVIGKEGWEAYELTFRGLIEYGDGKALRNVGMYISIHKAPYTAARPSILTCMFNSGNHLSDFYETCDLVV